MRPIAQKCALFAHKMGQRFFFYYYYYYFFLIYILTKDFFSRDVEMIFFLTVSSCLRVHSGGDVLMWFTRNHLIHPTIYLNRAILVLGDYGHSMGSILVFSCCSLLQISHKNLHEFSQFVASFL